MRIKAKLRSLLGDLLAKHEVEKTRDRVVNRQAIKHVLINENSLPPEAQSQTQGGLLRILATDVKNAKQIARQIETHKDDLNVRSVHILEKALDYKPRPKQLPLFHNSVLVRLDPAYLLRDSLHSIDQYKAELSKEVLDTDVEGRVVIDFSSPNIAKPFHYGHLKSTLLGNFLANIYKFLGHDVVKLNYIGDWGTQYGLLNLGLEEQDNRLPALSDGATVLRHLVEIYVKANERGQNDESFFKLAKQKFQEMETDPKQREIWQRIRNISLEELRKSYARLGIEFDAFEFESDYAKISLEIVKEMEKSHPVRKLADGVVVALIEKNLRNLEVPIQRSDGASLYLTRDIAAAISRKQKYNFDKMLYIVGADQERHFHALKEIIRNFGHDWSQDLIHVKMAKVLGMSTRSGNFVLLSDIVDKTVQNYIESTRNVVTSKVKTESDLDNVAGQLALSALFVFDMRNARTKHYEFDWELVVLRSERSGLNLQATHARLSSLLERAATEGLHPARHEELTIDALCCSEAMDLLSLLSEIDSRLYDSYWSQDPSPIVNYALDLCKAINRARQSDRLQVLVAKDESHARTRLAVFQHARDRLNLLIKMIGLTPLDKV